MKIKAFLFLAIPVEDPDLELREGEGGGGGRVEVAVLFACPTGFSSISVFFFFFQNRGEGRATSPRTATAISLQGARRRQVGTRLRVKNPKQLKFPTGYLQTFGCKESEVKKMKPFQHLTTKSGNGLSRRHLKN